MMFFEVWHRIAALGQSIQLVNVKLSQVWCKRLKHMQIEYTVIVIVIVIGIIVVVVVLLLLLLILIIIIIIIIIAIVIITIATIATIATTKMPQRF